MLVSKKGLTVIDWEWVRRSCGATDVGQFAASCYFLDQFRGGRGMLRVFLRSYVEATKPDHAFVKRVMVQFGVHIISWPVSRMNGVARKQKQVYQMVSRFSGGWSMRTGLG